MRYMDTLHRICEGPIDAFQRDDEWIFYAECWCGWFASCSTPDSWRTRAVRRRAFSEHLKEVGLL